mgnify:CR=1 FL=1
MRKTRNQAVKGMTGTESNRRFIIIIIIISFFRSSPFFFFFFFLFLVLFLFCRQEFEAVFDKQGMRTFSLPLCQACNSSSSSSFSFSIFLSFPFFPFRFFFFFFFASRRGRFGDTDNAHRGAFAGIGHQAKLRRGAGQRRVHGGRQLGRCVAPARCNAYLLTSCPTTQDCRRFLFLPGWRHLACPSGSKSLARCDIMQMNKKEKQGV